jgi:hypothetical protein
VFHLIACKHGLRGPACLCYHGVVRRFDLTEMPLGSISGSRDPRRAISSTGAVGGLEGYDGARPLTNVGLLKLVLSIAGSSRKTLAHFVGQCRKTMRRISEGGTLPQVDSRRLFSREKPKPLEYASRVDPSLHPAWQLFD